jgi:hypothetical protein
MSTLQMPQQPAPACPSDKKPYASRKEAEQFEAENHTRFPNQGRQYAYQCSECPAYHLTSKSPDAYAIGLTNLKRMEPSAPEVTSKTPQKRGRRGDTEAAVKNLWQQGMSDMDIAAQLGVSSQTVSYHRKKLGTAKSRTEYNAPLRQIKPPLTISEANEQQRLLDDDYQAKKLLLEQHTQRLTEANKLTVCECQDGQALFIKFGQSEHMIVPKDKITELIDGPMSSL